MGVDFLKSKQKKFAKGWDAERLASSRRRLGNESGILANEVVARTLGVANLHEGDDVLVRADGECLSVIVDLAPTAILLEPTSAIVKAVRESGGYAHGLIQAVYPSLGLLKVQLQ